MIQRRSTILAFTLLLLVPTLLFSACTDAFSSINSDPTEATEVPEGPLFTRSLRKAMLDDFTWQVGEHLHANMFVQHFANVIGGFNTDRYEVNDAWLTRYWDIAYTDFGKDIQQVIDQSRGNEQKAIKLAQARIWKVFIVQRLTDFFGDIPYSEAFRGDGTPAYDRQQDIYRDLFARLDSSVTQLSSSPSNQNRFGAADVLYGDDVTLWKKFANSLRLRLAMRVSNIDAELAQQQAQAAINGDDGLISANTESATLDPNGSSRTESNPLATVMSFQDSRVSRTLEVKLRSLDDPRLKVYIDTALAGDTQARQGYPNGRTSTQISNSNPDTTSMAGPIFQDASNPISVMSHAEVKFLQAEAVVRGFVNGDAGSLYQQGIEAVMQRYDVAGDSVVAYLSQEEVAWDPSDSQDEKIRKIILQKWLALFGRSGFEAWAEYRRTGYPELQRIRAPGGGTTDGVVPRRVPYPNSEDQVNTENHQEAVSRLDQGDTYRSRLWWDVD